MLAINQDTNVYQSRRWLHNPKKIFGQYLFWGAIFVFLNVLYSAHTLYRDAFPGAHLFFNWFLRLYVFAGIPYFILTDKFRVSMKININDPYLISLVLLKRVLNLKSAQKRSIVINHRMKTFLIGGVLRTHFFAIMVSQIYPFLQQIQTGIYNGASDWSLATAGTILISVAWIVDGSNACLGYFWESKFTSTRFCKIDPNPLSWIITLSCYVPFSYWATSFIATNQSNSMINFQMTGLGGVNSLLDIITLIFLICYVASGTLLCFSTSNLSYKAIQTRGLYSIIRHPATLFKLGFFSINFFRFEQSITAYGLLAFTTVLGIYIARIFCEERFLNTFKEYQDYKLKTRYRLIPGVF
jgi:protein-S-isoprenylcysteine O-methyltransferase Ste14